MLFYNNICFILKASTVVELTVLDANDNTPSFDRSSYSYNVQEQNVQTDLFLLEVVATDSDGTSPNNEVSYDITSGNEDKKFKIDANVGLF